MRAEIAFNAEGGDETFGDWPLGQAAGGDVDLDNLAGHDRNCYVSADQISAGIANRGVGAGPLRLSVSAPMRTPCVVPDMWPYRKEVRADSWMNLRIRRILNPGVQVPVLLLSGRNPYEENRGSAKQPNMSNVRKRRNETARNRPLGGRLQARCRSGRFGRFI